eukprot:GHVN01055928.1.p1 GENE.GHVN01055928.1~~GHVN01055928.1.p1  ORF type:complete len:890 (-),score=170.70 GHVN01055928.1:154-2823(-)
MMIRVYNYNTMEKIKEFEAHNDYIRYLAVHPSLSYVLSTADDMTVKLWDWDNQWNRTLTFEGHAHYVMMAQWNPKDVHIFATASLDRTIKVWGVNAPNSAVGGVVNTPHFTLVGHEQGVNCVEYSPINERPYMISGSDDNTVRVWDYQTKQCIMTLPGHSKNVSAALFHPHLPIIITGSEDGQCRIWHATTYRLETVLSYQLDRVWSISCARGSNAVAMGFDNGTLVMKLGSEAPVCSMCNGKVAWTRGAEIMAGNARLVDETSYADGERMPMSAKDMGACEYFPQTISHHPSGRFIAVCGDGDFVIYTAQALRNMGYGPATDFVWSPEGHYATRVENEIKIYQDFKPRFSFKTSFPAEELFGGRLIGVRSSDFICFYDWQEYRMIRRIDVSPRGVWWNENGSRVALGCQDSLYILKHDTEAVAAAVAGGAAEEDEGIEIAFEFIQEINERTETGLWVCESFLYVTPTLRLQIVNSSLIDTVAFLDRPMYLLGYLGDTNKVYLMDRDNSIITYTVYRSFLDYQQAVSGGDLGAAKELFNTLPLAVANKAAKFLESQGYKEEALEATNDPDHKFDLCLALGYLTRCEEVIKSVTSEATGDAATGVSVESKAKWQQLGDASMEKGLFDLSLRCFNESDDIGGLLLMHYASGNGDGLKEIAEKAAKEKKMNVSFVCHLSVNDTDKCLQVLLDGKRYPEAALFARTYMPHKVDECVKLWQTVLDNGPRQAKVTLASPSTHPDLFPIPAPPVAQGIEVDTNLIDVSPKGESDSNAVSEGMRVDELPPTGGDGDDMFKAVSPTGGAEKAPPHTGIDDVDQVRHTEKTETDQFIDASEDVSDVLGLSGSTPLAVSEETGADNTFDYARVDQVSEMRKTELGEVPTDGNNSDNLGEW